MWKVTRYFNIYRGPEKGSAALHLHNSKHSVELLRQKGHYKHDVPQTRVAFRIERIYCTLH
jgi:hypothetical protein